MTMRIVVVGNGPAAVSAIEAIREIDSTSEIVVIAPEGPRAYTPCFLGRYVSGTIGVEDLAFRAADFYEAQAAELLIGDPVVRVHPEGRQVELASGRTVDYDRLLLANGAETVVPDIAGITGPGVVGFRNLADCEDIRAGIHDVRHAVVLGSGFVALEAAEALIEAGTRVSMIVRTDRILRRLFDAEVAGLIEEHAAAHGVRLLKHSEVVEVDRDSSGRLVGLALGSGERMPCDLLVLAAGMRPHTELVLGTSIAVDQGILTDAYLRTSVANVWAAGDVAEPEVGGVRRTNLLHPNAVITGRAAGRSIAGADKPLSAHFGDANILMIFGRRYLSAGAITQDYLERHASDSGDLLKIFLRDGTICGVHMAGDVTRGGLYVSLIGRRLPEGLADRLLSPHLNFGEIERWPWVF